MKTKLTLNIDGEIVARAKKLCAQKKVSLSSVVENYLDRFSKNNIQSKDVKPQTSLLERIRKYTQHVEFSDKEIEEI